MTPYASRPKRSPSVVGAVTIDGVTDFAKIALAYLVQRLGYRALEVPIYFEDRRIGRSKMTVPVKLEAAWRVWEVRAKHRRLTTADRRAAA